MGRNRSIRIVLAALISLLIGGSYGANANPGAFAMTLFMPMVRLNFEALPLAWQDGLAPGVNWGLAEAYPQDVGITQNSYVLAAEAFETGSVTIPTEDDRYRLNTTVVRSPVYTGSYAGEHRWPQGYNGPTTRFQIPASAHQGAQPAYSCVCVSTSTPASTPGRTT